MGGRLKLVAIAVAMIVALDLAIGLVVSAWVAMVLLGLVIVALVGLTVSVSLALATLSYRTQQRVIPRRAARDLIFTVEEICS